MKFIRITTVTVLTAILSIQLSTGTAAAQGSGGLSSKGNEFFLGFFGNSERYDVTDKVSSVALLVTTDDEDPVNFTVKYFNISLTRKAQRGQTTRIDLPTSSRNNDIRVQNMTERNKAIHVKAEGDKLLTVYGISTVSSDMFEGFLALPCHYYENISKYKYTVFSAQTDDTGSLTTELRKSRILIVACDQKENTSVEIRLTDVVEVPNSWPGTKRKYDAKDKLSLDDTLIPGGTVMIETPAGRDLSGTFIRSDKPISVFVGHRCAQVPTGMDHCNYIVEQIPPDVTWGTKFFTVPLGLRRSGELYRIETTNQKDDVTVTVNVTCMTEGEVQPRVVFRNEKIKRFDHREFNTSVNCSNSTGGSSSCRRDFCCIETSEPAIVMMYGKGDQLDKVRPPEESDSFGAWGDPTMVLVPPVHQYSNDFTISTRDDLTMDTFYSYISYAIPAEHFNNSTADRSAFTINDTEFSPESEYQPIYCSNGEICGYGAYSNITNNDHLVQYNKAGAGMYLYVYGFTEFASIAYPAGFNMDPLPSPTTPEPTPTITVTETTMDPGPPTPTPIPTPEPIPITTPRVPIETTTDPPAIKFPQHDDPTEICITFSTGDLQGADSRSIFVTVQAENEGLEDLFVDDSNFKIHTVNVIVEELADDPTLQETPECCTEPVELGFFDLIFISTSPCCHDSGNCISNSVGDDRQVVCFTSDIATSGVYNVTVGFKHNIMGIPPPEPDVCSDDLTSQLKQLPDLMVNNILYVLENLVQLSVNSVPCRADQTPENLEIFADIFEAIANIMTMHKEQLNLTIRNLIVETSVQIVNSLLQWNVSAIEAEFASRLVRSFEAITFTYSQGLPQNTTQNFLFPFITLNTQMSDLEYLQDQGRGFRPLQMSDSLRSSAPSIELPPSLFDQIQLDNATISIGESNAVGVVFAFYEKSTLFPVGEHITNGTNSSMTRVATEIIAAHIAERSIHGLQHPVVVTLKRKEDFLYKPGTERCVSWDFDLHDWTTSGCNTTTNENGIFTCTCDHLTNFAVLMDICLRLEDCQASDPIIDSLLTYISYIGIAISIVALILTIITILGFKKLRKKDGADHHIQLSVSLLLLMVVALVMVTLSPGTTDLLYGGCMTISVLVHYFALVAVMWMGAEALLMFRKIVIVFVRITRTYLVGVALICWLVPLVPVLASLIVDLSMGDDPASDIIIRRSSDQDSNLAFCFLSHVGAFWGAFLAPILLIMVFNIITFVCIVFVLFRHVCSTSLHTKQKIKPKEIIFMMIRIGGVMSLFGLTWLFAILTVVSTPALREVFQILFTVFNSLQGAFIFLFFCVMNKEARKLWKEFFFGKFLKKKHYKVSKFSSHDHHKTSEHALESSSIGMSPLPTKSEKIQQSISNDEVKVDLSDSAEKQPIE